ncbi:hypothetical protein BN59_01770 [Legionella massiliensis]|uniref:Coiled coil domain-containing protein n=1 Tax=Legionella massiliensis TaxID=1034943 RepID=A0A078KWV3_9GAMM|nr:hypothetical protein [Legionella massiliensis]CDZ77487.1 hypothetical protein BN59_01770 [Legionella massiliensis]CEE13225.1 hypothetical protein BN1094_01770 [Legionella massiliensis]
MSYSKPDIDTSLFAYNSRYKANWVESFKASSNYTGQLKCTDSFDAFQQNLIGDTEGLSTVKTRDGKTLTEKLRDAAPGTPGQLAKEALDGALKSDKLEKALTGFSKEIKGLNTLIASDEPEFLPGDIGSFLLSMKGNAVAEINNQLSEAKSKINDLFANNADFKNNLQTSLGCPPEELETVKADMLAALDENNKKQLADLEKALEDSAKELFVESRKQFFRIYWLSYNYNRDANMKADMDKQMASKLNGTTMDFNFASSDGSLRDVDISKLSVFTTSNNGWFSGGTITKTENGFNVSFSQFFETEDSARAKVASIVAIALAQGLDSYTLTITNKDPERADEDARLAYEGAILAGMDPKKITIKTNHGTGIEYDSKGNLKTSPDKSIFKDFPQRLQVAQGKAAAITQRVEQFSKGSENATRQIKQRLIAMQGPESTSTPTPGII